MVKNILVDKKARLLFLLMNLFVSCVGTAGNVVGNPNTSFSVSSNGAALYHIDIDAPDVGIRPNIGIAFNS